MKLHLYFAKSKVLQSSSSSSSSSKSKEKDNGVEDEDEYEPKDELNPLPATLT
jgi:hypothetical protein